MTRMYLSPTATVFAKIGLVFVQILMGLCSAITFPIRKITLKAYGLILVVAGAAYTVCFHADLKAHLTALMAVFGLLAVSIVLTRLVHKILTNKVGPRVAVMINSPLGIPLKKYYPIAG